MELKAGDGIMFRTPLGLSPMGWLSFFIRVFTRSPYNHAGIVVEIDGKLFITEADENGVHSELLKSRLERTKSKLLIIRPKFEINKEMVKMRAMSIWGAKYGEMLLIKYAFAILTGQPLRSKKARTGERFVCTHVWGYCLNLREWWRISPKEMYNDERFTHIEWT